MLPEDTRQRKEAALDYSMQSQQTVLSDHFNVLDEPIIPYSNRAFKVAAIDWLIDANQVHSFPLLSPNSNHESLQPIQTFKNPKFKAMLNMAARATKGIIVPTPRKTRGHVILSFKQKMYLLRDRLKVCVDILFHCLFTLTSMHIGPHCSRGNQSDV